MVLQVRAGTGGDEAALFAGDVLRMYEKAAALYGWRFEVSTLIKTGKHITDPGEEAGFHWLGSAVAAQSL